MEFYEWVFFLFMWLFIFAGVALMGLADEPTAANSMSDVPAIGSWGILAYIVFRMDRSARSGIDMAKRRERFIHAG